MPLPQLTASASLRTSAIPESGFASDARGGLGAATTYYAIAEWSDDNGTVRARGCGEGSTIEKAIARAEQDAGAAPPNAPNIRVIPANKAEYKACRKATKATAMNNAIGTAFNF